MPDQATHSHSATNAGADPVPPATPDLEAYLKRIGYAGECRPELAVLREIQRQHAQTIPFENLNPLLRWPVLLDIASVQQKLVRDGRGGYCFEQNRLLSQVLKTIGFRVKELAARVLWNQPEGSVTARVHMLLLVEVNGDPFIADVGFGGMSLTAPLKLMPDIEQTTPHGVFRLVRADDEYVLQGRVRQEWKSLYRFSLLEHLPADYEAASWYLCHYPQSQFINALIVARPGSGVRYTLRNTHLSIHHPDGTTLPERITTLARMKEVLSGIFGITLPHAPELDSVLQEIIQKDT
jgi:N-hydroxyarylamine O-acetyltransferase